ncbi:MAG: radical SAM protein [Candidatus Methanomethylicaceae archaeon]
MIISYRPKVYSISITGDKCSLMCEHCKGVFLKNMKYAFTINEILRAFQNAKNKGMKFVLISGGFDKYGKLPISNFLNIIKKAKEETGLIVEIHLGLYKNLEEVKGIDAILLDVIGSQDTIKNYIKGEWNVEDYEFVMKEAKKFIPLVAAHILIGVDNGKIKGEYNAIDMAIRANVDALSILTLINGGCKIEDIKNVMKYARDNYNGHLTLGCMRTKGSMRLIIEKIAIDYGYNGIANPSNESIIYAKNLGLEVKEVLACCAFTLDKIPMNTKY